MSYDGGAIIMTYDVDSTVKSTTRHIYLKIEGLNEVTKVVVDGTELDPAPFNE